MENIKELKKDFEDKFNSLSEDRQKEILKFYGVYSVFSLMNRAKDEAQSNIDFADRKGYGYGEMGYHLNEDVEDFAEDVPELKYEYSNLLNGYFELLIETNEA